MTPKPRIIIIILMFLLPIMIGGVVYEVWFGKNGRLTKKYECYPLHQCQFDINNDGIADRIESVNEPRPEEKYHLRLKIHVLERGTEREILNIENVNIDNTFRTHLAVLEENGTNKIVIYDTKNTEQFFHWNGTALIPTEDPSNLEQRIRTAMSMNDDTGGHHTRIFVELAFFLFCGLYYFLLVTTLLVLRSYRKNTSINLP